LYRFAPDSAWVTPRHARLYVFSNNNPLRYVDPDGRDVVAGAMTGGEIGSVGGPVGTVAGAIIGATIGLIAASVLIPDESPSQRFNEEIARRAAEQKGPPPPLEPPPPSFNMGPVAGALIGGVIGTILSSGTGTGTGPGIGTGTGTDTGSGSGSADPQGSGSGAGSGSASEDGDDLEPYRDPPRHWPKDRPWPPPGMRHPLPKATAKIKPKQLPWSGGNNAATETRKKPAYADGDGKVKDHEESEWMRRQQ
jgi:hypothetical protein